MNYDRKNPLSIEAYAKYLIGKTFAEVCEEDNVSDDKIVESNDYAEEHADKNRKGGLGELIEEKYFHYKANSDSRPDFEEAGVELKVTPYKENKRGAFSAKERLIINMIDYNSVVNESFEESHFRSKANLILLIYYLYNKDLQNRLDYKINYVQLFSPPPHDIEIIRQDYEKIVNKIKQGKAHELSEGDTLYLGAATKSATSKNRRTQPFSDELAKPRAFAFKSSYMTHVLNTYIIPGVSTYKPTKAEENDNGIQTHFESILPLDGNENFEEYVAKKIGLYKGLSEQELCSRFEISYTRKPKNLGAMLAYRMLGIKGNKAEEFEKANIVLKTIRIGQNNRIKESMSFPTFKFKELVQEEWDDSTFGNYLRETRFLFIVYKYDENDVLRLKGAKFWNIPYSDLEVEVRGVWEKTKQVLIEGLKLENRNGKVINNFPKASQNTVCHVRPHGQNANDTYELPDGREYTKQCFWLNNSYILSQMDDEFLDK